MEHHGTFGPDAFGRAAEHAARFFGTPQYIIGQSIVVVLWITLNAVAVVQTRLQPVELLMVLHGVETAMGRLRSAPNAPRTLDLDLLDYEGRVLSGSELALPHPRIAARSFVLVPLQDVAPDWRHPVTGQGVPELLAALPDRDTPKRLP